MRRITIAPITALLALGATSALAQDEADVTAPVVVITSPTTGEVLDTQTKRVTVTGTADDENGATLVQYRIEGSRRWRSARISTIGWSFSFDLKKGKRKHRRVYVRAFDDSNNESDIIGRKIRRR